MATAGLEGELRNGDGRQGGARIGVALQATVAAAISAGVRAWVRREVAVTTTPDATRLPIVRDCEGNSLTRGLLPSGRLVGDGSAGAQISEELTVLHEFICYGSCTERSTHTGPYSVGALIDDREGTCGRGGGERKGGSGGNEALHCGNSLLFTKL